MPSNTYLNYLKHGIYFYNILYHIIIKTPIFYFFDNNDVHVKFGINEITQSYQKKITNPSDFNNL